MKNFLRLTILVVFINLISCKKAIEKKQLDILIDAITNGEWQVHQYLESSVDITSQFSGYGFKFEKHGTVQAKQAGSSVADGTWVGDIDNYTINSQFVTAPDTIKKLNGTWKLTDTYWDYVEAEMTTSTGKNFLHLIKKP